MTGYERILTSAPIWDVECKLEKYNQLYRALVIKQWFLNAFVPHDSFNTAQTLSRANQRAIAVRDITVRFYAQYSMQAVIAWIWLYCLFIIIPHGFMLSPAIAAALAFIAALIAGLTSTSVLPGEAKVYRQEGMSKGMIVRALGVGFVTQLALVGGFAAVALLMDALGASGVVPLASAAVVAVVTSVFVLWRLGY